MHLEVVVPEQYPENSSPEPGATAPPGIDVAAITRWLTEAEQARGGTVSAPLSFEQIAGGRSNLTFRVADRDGHQWALRRPPTGHVLATAHDMGREHSMMSALAPTDVPVPTMVGLCRDTAVNGAEFFVMDWVDGTVVRNNRIANTFDPPIRRRMCEALIDTLAAIHAVDIDQVGLGQFAKRSGYVERQLRRWMGQVDATESPTAPEIAEAHKRLVDSVPEQQETRLIHGDYRLDNTIVTAEGDIAAVLDWELTTLGDPRADLGATLAYWSRPGDPVVALSNPPTLAEGMLERDDVVARYEAATGSPADDVEWFQAFATWRLACILDGVVDRYRAGAMGNDDDFNIEVFATQVATLASGAIELLDAS